MKTYHYRNLIVEVVENSATDAVATLTKDAPKGRKSVATVTATFQTEGLVVGVQWDMIRFLAAAEQRELMNENAVYKYAARHISTTPYALLCGYFADRSKAIVKAKERKEQRGDKTR
jgi:hypothetical protein